MDRFQGRDGATQFFFVLSQKHHLHSTLMSCNP